MTDKWNTREAWIPEAQPKLSGVYAPANYKAGVNTMTRDPWDAMQFKTKKACQDWCDANPDPPFIPVSHGFAEKE